LVELIIDFDIASQDKNRQTEEITRITTPTLHLHGLKDASLEPGRLQKATYFDPNSSSSIEIDYHHAMPWTNTDLLTFAEKIRGLYNETGK